MTRIVPAGHPKAASLKATPGHQPEASADRGKAPRHALARPVQDTLRAGLLQQMIAQARRQKEPVRQGGDENPPTLLAAFYPVDVQPAGDQQPGIGHAVAPGLVGAGRAEWLEGLLARVDHALAATPREVDGSMTLTLDLSGREAEGLRGVEVAMSPMAIDVVLRRTEGQASAEYLAATQVLAERLHERFSRRIVRVHEVVQGPDARLSRTADPRPGRIRRNGDGEV